MGRRLMWMEARCSSSFQFLVLSFQQVPLILKTENRLLETGE